MHLRTLTFALSGAAIAVTLAAPARAAYPDRPVRIIVPYTAGGASDAVTRIIANKLGELWKVSVIVDNRGGGAGNIGCEMAAKAAPDGYTLLMSTVGTHGINPSLFSKLPYDPVKDFAPISLAASTVSVLLVNPSVPVDSVAELIAYAKAHPGQINFGSSGNGSSHHLAGEMFNTLAGVRTVHVPYKGTSGMYTDLLAGQIQMTFDPVLSALPHIKSHKLKALAVTSPQRVEILPDVPSMQESGVAGYEMGSWYGLLAPAGTSPEIVQKVSADVARIVNLPDVKQQLLEQGATPIGSTPAQLGQHIQREIKKWAEVVRYSGATVN
ncbi:tripartite tricarboxylate transporter substrate binding protein [Pigmentiphaga soli]|uniref:Tripartite tricarboxylate transporter substrate binding protein n=1 Tax=Pigmentiphaga soli TaxID=1007095 RepID=A0ABP8GGI0_9BURK